MADSCVSARGGVRGKVQNKNAMQQELISLFNIQWIFFGTPAGVSIAGCAG
jgi:hypothetical protein